MRHIKEIILHCTATKEGKDFKAADIDKWHKANGWSGIGYHYCIDLDGTIEKGRPEEQVGAHCSGHNKNSIGIVYVGGLDADGKAKDTRTQAQKDALIDLTFLLLQKYHLDINAVKTHNVINPHKQCPSFSLNDFRLEYLKETSPNM